MTDYSRDKIIDCLIAAYRHHKAEDCWDTDETEPQYLERLQRSSMEELMHETCTDEDFPLQEFIYAYS
jgi:DNA-binding transcriptional regulator PaaX